MLGVDCLVAGEVLRHEQPDKDGTATQRNLVGLLRVTIDGSLVEAHRRLAALDGRLLVTTAQRVKQPMPGATYRLLAMEDASKQLAELIALLQLTEAAHHTTGSRCGICNGDAWQRLPPSEVEASQVPQSVLRQQPVFFRCGVCRQIFWPSGRKPAPRDAPSEDASDAADVTTLWRPSSRMMMALGANSKSGGQMLREARGLHSSLRMQLEEPRLVQVDATYYY